MKNLKRSSCSWESRCRRHRQRRENRKEQPIPADDRQADVSILGRMQAAGADGRRDRFKRL
jgi:hypothetical protein